MQKAAGGSRQGLQVLGLSHVGNIVPPFHQKQCVYEVEVAQFIPGGTVECRYGERAGIKICTCLMQYANILTHWETGPRDYYPLRSHTTRRDCGTRAAAKDMTHRSANSPSKEE